MYEIDDSQGIKHEAEQPAPPIRNPLKPHGCTRCSKSFTSVHQLAQHTRVHTGEKPYKCPFCDRRFKQQSHVKQHSRLHTGERPYKCSEPSCGRSFVQLSNLQQHMGNHSKDGDSSRALNHHCQICGKGFATESSLSLHHSKKHNDLRLDASPAERFAKGKDFVCKVCSKSYTTESALVIHSSKHKVDQKSQARGIVCRECPESFISVEGLEEHMKIAHSPRHPAIPYPPLPYCPTSAGHPNVPHHPQVHAGIPWLDPHAFSHPFPHPSSMPSPSFPDRHKDVK